MNDKAAHGWRARTQSNACRVSVASPNRADHFQVLVSRDRLLKDSADVAVRTMSHLVHDARGHLEQLPLPHHRTPWWRSKWSIAALMGVAGVAGYRMLRERRTESPDGDRAPTLVERRAAMAA